MAEPLTADEFITEVRKMKPRPATVYVNCTLKQQLELRHRVSLATMGVKLGDLCCEVAAPTASDDLP